MQLPAASIDQLIPDWLWNSSTQLILVIDERGNPININPSMRKVVKRPTPLHEDSLRGIFHYPQIDADGFASLLSKSNRHKLTMAVKSGFNGSQHLTWTDWEFSKIKLEDTCMYVGIGSVSRDITDQAMHKSISKAILDGAMLSITDAKGVIISTNQRFAEFTQFSENELVGKMHKEIFADLHTRDFWHAMLITIRSGQIWNEDVMIKIKNGEAKWLHTIVSPVMDLDNEIHRILHIQFDISSYKKLLKHKEALREIAFIQSHEFRRPVANMLGIIDLINSDPETEKLPRGLAILIDMLRQSVQDTDKIIAKIVSKASKD